MELIMILTAIFLLVMMMIIIILLAPIISIALRLVAAKWIFNDRTQPPVEGTVFHQLLYFKTLYHHQTHLARKHRTFRLLAPNHHSAFYTTDAANVEHILKTRFEKYVKGDDQLEIFRDLFGEGIFAVNGDKWRHQRKLASFEFSTRVLRDFSCGVFRRTGVKLVRIISDKRNQPFDIHELLMRCTLDSIFKIGFGVELGCLEGLTEKGTQFMKAFDEANALVYLRFVDPFWKVKRALNIGSESVLKTHMNTIDEFVRGLIKGKRKILLQQQEEDHHSMEKKEDILSRFIEASKEDPDGMNDQYLRDIILNFIIAGKDSTANTLSWFIYALCNNPQVQERISQQLKQIINIDDVHMVSSSPNEFLDLITDEVLDKMHYLHAALTETLRLYPGVPVDGRTATEDDILPDGYRVRKGDGIFYIAYAMGRMPYIWGDDAHQFRPDRWLQNGVFKPESPFKLVSFHAGPRICLGKDFAYRQMKIISIALIRYFQFKLADESTKVTYKTMFTLHIHGGLHVHALPRNVAFS